VTHGVSLLSLLAPTLVYQCELVALSTLSSYHNLTTAALTPDSMADVQTPRQVADRLRSRGGGVTVTLVQHGRLFGDLPEREPLPFATGPTDKPTVTESFAKQASSNKGWQ